MTKQPTSTTSTIPTPSERGMPPQFSAVSQVHEPGRLDGGAPTKPAAEPAKASSVNIEEFATNIARMVEEGGKALAAYLKAREEGQVDEQQSEVSDVVKTFGKVAEYWLADPQRALEMQTSLGKAYLDLWASAVKRMAGEDVAPVAKPEPR